jgi:hypothetical protein
MIPKKRNEDNTYTKFSFTKFFASENVLKVTELLTYGDGLSSVVESG